MKYKVSFKDLKSEKQFLKMIAANMVNRFGDSIDLIAFQWIVYQVTGNAVLIAIVGGVNYIPNLIFQPFAGVLVEKWNKKMVMVCCDLGRCLITFCVGVLLLTGKINFAILIVITFLNSTFESFRLPAAVAIRPQLISKDKYTVGISMDTSISRLMELTGFGCAGFIIALSPSLAVFIDSLTFLISAAVIMGIICKRNAVEDNVKIEKSYMENFKDGLRYLKVNKIVLYMAVWGAAVNISGTQIGSFQTIYVADYLKLSVKFLSMISIASTLGMSLGAFFAPKIQEAIKERFILAFAGIGCAAVYLVLSFLPEVNVIFIKGLSVIVILFVNGLIAGIVGVIYNSVFLRSIDDEYIGRVAGIFGAMCAATIPLSSFIFAGLAGIFTIPVIFIISAALCVATYCSILFIKELKK